MLHFYGNFINMTNKHWRKFILKSGRRTYLKI